MSKLSIIMPVLNEGEGIAAALDALAVLRALGTEDEAQDEPVPVLDEPAGQRA